MHSPRTEVDVAKRVGRYEVLGELGRGRSSRVYVARQTDLSRIVALKETAVDGRDPGVGARLTHPHVVLVHEAFEQDGARYVAMEVMERGSLRAFVGRLSVAQVGGVLEAVLAALVHAEERGVGHGRLTPENLLVTGDGRVKVADFGIADASGRDVGTWTDLRAVGAIAAELLTGRVPTQAEVAAAGGSFAAAAGVAPPLAHWIDRLVAADPTHAPRSADEAWDELEDALVDLLGPRWRRQARLLEPSRRRGCAAARRRRPVAAAPAGAGAAAGRACAADGGRGARAARAARLDAGVVPHRAGRVAARADRRRRGRERASPPGWTPESFPTEADESAPPEPARPSPAVQPAWTPEPDASTPPEPARRSPPAPPVWAPEPNASAPPEPAIPAPAVPPVRAPEPDGSTQPAIPAPREASAAAFQAPAAPPAEPAPSPPPCAPGTAVGFVTAQPNPWEPSEPPPSRPPGAHDAGADRRARKRERRRRRRRTAVRAVVLLAAMALAATAGAMVGAPPAAEPPSQTVALTAGDVSTRVPSDHRPVPPPEVPGLALRDAAAVALRGLLAGAAVMIGTAASTHPTLLPPAFRRALGLGDRAVPERTAVRLAGGLEAYRYAALAPRGFDGVVTLYASPTSNGIAVVACASPEAAVARLSGPCDGAAQALAVGADRRFPVGPDPAYARRLRRVLGDLRTTVARARADLRRPGRRRPGAGRGGPSDRRGLPVGGRGARRSDVEPGRPRARRRPPREPPPRGARLARTARAARERTSRDSPPRGGARGGRSAGSRAPWLHSKGPATRSGADGMRFLLLTGVAAALAFGAGYAIAGAAEKTDAPAPSSPEPPAAVEVRRTAVIPTTPKPLRTLPKLNVPTPTPTPAPVAPVVPIAPPAPTPTPDEEQPADEEQQSNDDGGQQPNANQRARQRRQESRLVGRANPTRRRIPAPRRSGSP